MPRIGPAIDIHVKSFTDVRRALGQLDRMVRELERHDGYKSEWKAFTPGWWTASGDQPSIGNGTLTARWMQIGAMVIFDMFLSSGSTTVYEPTAMAWGFGLPMAAKPDHTIIGSGVAHDRTYPQIGTSHVVWPLINNAVEGALGFRIETQRPRVGSPDAAVDRVVPFTWGNADPHRLYIHLQYPIVVV